MGLYKIIDITEADFGCEEPSTGLMRCWCLKTEAAGKSPKAVDWLPADMEVMEMILG